PSSRSRRPQERMCLGDKPCPTRFAKTGGIMSRAFRIDMNGGQEVPANASSATGLGVAVYDDSGVDPTLEYTVVTRGVVGGPFTFQSAQTAATNDNVTDAHFHQAAVGVSGPVRFGWKTADADDF